MRCGWTSVNNNYQCKLTYIGYQTGYAALCTTTAVGIGYGAAYCSCGGNSKIAIGYRANCAGRSNYSNVSLGDHADCLGYWTYRSISVGRSAASNGGYHCDFVGIGYYANNFSYVARYTTAIGAYAGYCNNYGYYNTFVGSCASYFGGRGGWNSFCHNTNIGFRAGAYNVVGYGGCNGKCNVYIGHNSRFYNSGATYNCNELVIGNCALSNGNHTTTIGNNFTTNTYLCGAVTKGSGSFRIVHPNPEKKNKWLFHSFVESPTAGDNIYRWSVDVCGCSCSIELPDYYKYLNENDMAWVKPVDHFGSAYAEVDKEQDNLIICSNKDGCYNVILIGTRCDDQGAKSWTGTERDMDENDIKQHADKYANVVQ
jgi:hypothetical protein